MITEITNGVQVSVEAFYQETHSRPTNHEFLFAYRITIENFTNQTLKLMRRRWHIFDSNGDHREVEGEGVVGRQPVLAPGDDFTYVSACNLKTEIGKMRGTYTFKTESGQGVLGKIPEFTMIAPHKLS